MAHELSIILPTYNEKDNILVLLKEIDNVLSCDYEVIIVDDDSPDGTWQLIKSYQEKDQRIKLIHRTNERGLTSALNAGIKLAKGKLIMWMDVDLSMPPEKIPELLIAIESGADVAVGSRYVSGGRDDRAVNFHLTTQKFLSKHINVLCGKLLKCNFLDWTSGFIVLRRSLLDNYRLTGDYGEYFIHLINYLCHIPNVKIREIPYTIVPRQRGTSKTATNLSGFFRRGKKYILMILFLVIKNRRNKP